MAESLRINLCLCVILVLISVVLSSSVFKRDVLAVEQQQEPELIDPVVVGELNEDLFGGDDGTRGDRDKRFVKFAVVKKIGLKAFLINFIFGKLDSFIDAKTKAINQLDQINVAKNSYYGINPPKNPQKQTTPAPVEFQTNSPVSLVIPDRLYGSSFSLITNISNIIGDVLFNTADRAQELADRVNDKLRTKFGFKTKVFSISSGSGSSSGSNTYR